jgi:hypothetical protein
MRLMLIVIALLLISGCMPRIPPVVHHDVYYVGDSLCHSTHDYWGLTAAQQAGIVSRCVPGRKIGAVSELPDARIVFLGLVTNDCNRTPIDDYRAKLQQLLLSTDATVYCVLPTSLIRGESCATLANVMLDECVNTINPHDYNVGPRAKDGYHWNPVDHNNFLPAIKMRL